MMKQIKEFPNYAVAVTGRVWSQRRKRWLKCNVTNDGYLRITLCNNGKQKRIPVHRLVLETFVGPCPPGMQCRHLNGNPADNHLENLCWGTASENAQDSIRHGTHRVLNQQGELNVNAKLTEASVISIIQLYNTKLFLQREIADIFGVSRRCISHIINRTTWKHLL